MKVIRFRTVVAWLVCAGCLGTTQFSHVAAQQGSKDSKLSQGQHYADLAGIRLAYRVAGHGPLLIAQSVGWGMGSGYLQVGWKPLEDRFTVIYLDARANGLSSRPSDPSEMSISVMVDDLEHFRSFLGLSSINLLGHSGGGGISLGYAERYPDKVSKLVLIDSEVTDLHKEMGAETKRILEARSDDPRIVKAYAQFRNPIPTNDADFGKYLQDILPIYMYDPAKAVLAEKTFPNLPSAWTLHASSTASREHLLLESQDAHKVSAKTLIINGQADAVCPPSIAEELHGLIPNSELVLIDKSGHFPWIEGTETFFQQVESFLARP